MFSSEWSQDIQELQKRRLKKFKVLTRVNEKIATNSKEIK